MDRTPLHVGQRRAAIDDVAEHIEHARKNALADRHFQRALRIHDDAAAGQTLGRRHRDAAHMAGIAMRQHFDDDLAISPRTQHRMDGRKFCVEADIDHTAAHRNDDTRVRLVRCRRDRRCWRLAAGLGGCHQRLAGVIRD